MIVLLVILSGFIDFINFISIDILKLFGVSSSDDGANSFSN